MISFSLPGEDGSTETKLSVSYFLRARVRGLEEAEEIPSSQARELLEVETICFIFWIASARALVHSGAL